TAREVKGSVPRRGLCGDVFLESTPPGPRTDSVRADASVRKGECAISASLQNIEPEAKYKLHARVVADGQVVKEFSSPIFLGRDLKDGQIAFTEKWTPDRLWDTHTPQNVYSLMVALLDGTDNVLDTAWTVRFGFREFWIDGQDFFLNNSRIFLSAVPLD